jgi:hypothetical protein
VGLMGKDSIKNIRAADIAALFIYLKIISH